MYELVNIFWFIFECILKELNCINEVGVSKRGITCQTVVAF